MNAITNCCRSTNATPITTGSSSTSSTKNGSHPNQQQLQQRFRVPLASMEEDITEEGASGDQTRKDKASLNERLSNDNNKNDNPQLLNIAGLEKQLPIIKDGRSTDSEVSRNFQCIDNSL